MKRFLVCAAMLVAGCDAFAAEKFDGSRIRKSVAVELSAGHLDTEAAHAFTSMFQEAERQLKKRGKAEIGAQLMAEWNDFGAELLGVQFTDVGDHAPFSEWVAAWYQKLEDALGVEVMELTHLRDIWVLNYTLPVVFNPEAESKWCVEWKVQRPTDSCQAEYARHFVGTKWQRHPDPEADKILHHGFAPVVTYWLIWAGCQAATSGMGSLLVCSPAGTAGEFVMERYVAPPISSKIFERANPPTRDYCCACGDGCTCQDCPCHLDDAPDAKEPEAI